MKPTSFKEFSQCVDKIKFENFYRTHSNKEVLEHFNITKKTLSKILEFLDIKPKTKDEINTLIRYTLLNKTKEEKDLITKKRLDTRALWTTEYKEALSKK